MPARTWNDEIDALEIVLASPTGDVRGPSGAPEDYKPRDYTEMCSKCRGTGRFSRGRFVGRCFTCKGKGKQTFVTSPEVRNKAAIARLEKKNRSAEEKLADFKKEYPDIAAWIEYASPKFAFAASMREAIQKYGELTEGQMAACERCVERQKADQQKRDERIALAPSVISVSKIEDAFATARKNGLKRLRLRLANFNFSPGKEKTPQSGVIYVQQHKGEYLGKIANGKFICSRVCTDSQVADILRVIADPKAAAIAYGKEFGICSCCGRVLTDPDSIKLGIGPICADNWGMRNHD